MHRDLRIRLKEYLIERSVLKNHYPAKYWSKNQNFFIHLTFWIWIVWFLLSIFAIYFPISNNHMVGRGAVIAFESAFQYVVKILGRNSSGLIEDDTSSNLSPSFWNYEAYLFLYITIFLTILSFYCFKLVKKFLKDIQEILEKIEDKKGFSKILFFSKNLEIFWIFCFILTIWTTYALLHMDKPSSQSIGTWIFSEAVQEERTYMKNLTFIGKITGILNLISFVFILFFYSRYCRELFLGNIFYFPRFRTIFENKVQAEFDLSIQKSITQSLNVNSKGNFRVPNDKGYIVQLKNVNKHFLVSGGHFHALKDINLSIKKGEFIVILGYSGSGKTTLLNLLAGIDRPTTGVCVIDDCNTSLMTDSDLNMFRRKKIGYIFQNYALLPNLNVQENISITHNMDTLTFRFKFKKLFYDLKESNNFSEKMSMFLAFLKSIFMTQSGNDELFYLMDSLNLTDHRFKFPHQLSGGQQQRVAISRALIKKPKILLADEPTGAIDHSMTKSILELFYSINKYAGVTVILITHNPLISQMAKRVLHVEGGRIVKDVINKEPKHPQDIKGL